MAQPCPPWCEVGAGHPYGPFSDRSRVHAADAGEGMVITALTEAVAVDGPEVVQEAGISLDPPELVDAAAARSLAARLTEAADQLERLGLGGAVRA